MSSTMKNLTVDGNPVAVDVSRTFGAVAQEIKRGLGPERVLTEIFIDDRSIDLVEEENLQNKALSELGTVSFKTRDVVELFKESLGLAPKICEALLLDCDDIESFFAQNEMKAAQERIGELTSLLEWLLQLISGMQAIGGQPLEEMRYGEVSVSQSVHHMQNLLGKLHMQLAGKQWDQFRQTLREEFRPEMVNWKKLFEDAALTWNPRPSNRVS